MERKQGRYWGFRKKGQRFLLKAASCLDLYSFLLPCARRKRGLVVLKINCTAWPYFHFPFHLRSSYSPTPPPTPAGPLTFFILSFPSMTPLFLFFFTLFPSSSFLCSPFNFFLCLSSPFSAYSCLPPSFSSQSTPFPPSVSFSFSPPLPSDPIPTPTCIKR